MRAELANVVMKRLEALGRISDGQGRLTRTFCSPAMRRANDLVGGWMREAGMDVRTDAIGNLIGRYDSNSLKSKVLSQRSKVHSAQSAVQSGAGVSLASNRKTGQLRAGETPALLFLLGSHLDTVRDAGKFDGPLGVLVAIACVERLRAGKIRLPFAIEVVGFADEEG